MLLTMVVVQKLPQLQTQMPLPRHASHHHHQQPPPKNLKLNQSQNDHDPVQFCSAQLSGSGSILLNS
jgi:hypothetical protein